MFTSNHPSSILRNVVVMLSVGLALLVCTAQHAAADNIWYDASVSGFGFGGGSNYTIGEDFTVGSHFVNITALGFFDYQGDGLATAHQVNLYSLTGGSNANNGTLLATVTVPAGTAGTLIDDTRFVTLPSPIYLAPGTLASVVSYGFSASDPYGCCGGPLPTTGNLQWVGADRYDIGATGLPTFHATDGNNHAAANFLFINTPEPSSFILGGLGAVGLVTAARRRRKV